MSVAASLDLGSNTLRLLVAKIAPAGYTALERGLATPRLGKGLAAGAFLDPEAKALAREEAGRFAQRARELGAGVIALGATQACRVAADGREFVAGLQKELGLTSARVLSGAQEVRLSRLGVLSRLHCPPRGALLVDVGGGSSEFTWLDGPEDASPISLALGAVSLTEAHLKTDPPSAGELAGLDRAVDAALAGGGVKQMLGRAPLRLVATAGTAAAAAALNLGHTSYRPEELNNAGLSAVELHRQFTSLAAMDLAGRQKALALEPRRAEVIVAGLAVLRGLLRYFGLERITAMDAGLLEGILLDAACRASRGEQTA